MKRFHVHVSVNAIDESVRFYSKIFGAEPTVLKHDYAKWMVEDPRINFAISTCRTQAGVNHLGLQVDTEDELKSMRDQLTEADASIVEQLRRRHCDDNEVDDTQHERMLFMSGRSLNVLFLCTGNSARSIIAETLLNTMARGRLKAYSAGSHPGGTVNPLVLEYLHSRGLRTDDARSKSWDEFAAADAPRMDLIITVCNQAAGETCPVWPGHPARAHWSAPDPAAYMDNPDEARRVVREAFNLLQRRISLLLSLPLEKLDRERIETEARAIAEDTSPIRTD